MRHCLREMDPSASTFVANLDCYKNEGTRMSVNSRPMVCFFNYRGYQLCTYVPSAINIAH